LRDLPETLIPILCGSTLAANSSDESEMLSQITVAFVVVVGLLACGGDIASPPCVGADSSITFGLYVYPFDAVTNARLSATIVARDGTHEETLIPGPGTPGGPPAGYFGAMNRPGTYAITVTTSGYAPWRLEPVHVQRDNQCHLVPVSVEAPLSTDKAP
jgi:hypothetical protein